MILITGATGNVGQHLIPHLQARGLPFKVLQHKVAPAGVDAVEADAGRPETLPPAFEGIDTLFLLSPYTLELPRNEANLIAAANTAGVGHVVKLSAVGADPQSRSTVLSGHGESEAILRGSGVPFTIARANSFMENIPALFGESVKEGTGIAVAAGEGTVSWIGLDDLGAALATLLGGRAQGEVIELTGAEALSYRDVADLIAARTGKAVPYQPLTEAEARDGMAAAGFPDWMATGFASYFALQAGGLSSRVTPTLGEIIGHPPQRMGDFLAARLDGFR